MLLAARLGLATREVGLFALSDWLSGYAGRVQRIFVGDVQGCGDELSDLVARADASFGRDFELWLVGDLVNRGPSNLRVLEQVRALQDDGRARVVLGNHELSLLRVAYGQRPLASGDTLQEVLEASDAESWLEWLRGLPLVETGRLGAQHFAMVHASVAPGWSLDDLAGRARRVEARLRESRSEAKRLLAARPEDDPDADVLGRLTRARSVDARGRWSSREPASPDDAWHRRWAAQDPDYGVVYGHWATQGLHVAHNLRGLDTGCVYHGAYGDRFLTAWLPSDDGAAPFAVPDERFWRVAARGRGSSSRSENS
jgi:bis(5'-nucleosyl)-tetraphosphatase (symmetrical)